MFTFDETDAESTTSTMSHGETSVPIDSASKYTLTQSSYHSQEKHSVDPEAEVGAETKEDPAGEGREKHLYAGAQSGNENQNSTRDLFNNVDTTSFKLNKKTDYPERKQIVIQSYIDSVDKKLIHFYRDALQEKNKKRLEWMHYTFGELPRSILKKIDSLVGFNISDFVITINGEAVNHINKRHGAYGKQDSTMKMDEDIGRMNYVITHADDVEYTINSSGKHVIDSQYRNRENTPSKILSIRKRIDGAYYVIVAVPDNTAKRIVVKSAYLSEKTDDNQELSAKTLIATPEANLDVSSNKIVAQYAEKSQENYSVDPEAEAEERGKSTKADSLVDLYTEEQYNAFGWTRVNDVLTAVEKRTLDSAHMAYAKGFEARPVTRNGEIVILLGDNKDYTKLVYVKGTPEDQIITKVYSGETLALKEVEELESIRSRDAYETLEIYEEAGFVKESLPRNYPSYSESKRGRPRSEPAGAGDLAANAGRAGSAAEDPESLRGSICRRISSADIVVGIKEDGSATLYDLFNIKKKITENPVSSQNITAPTPSQDSSVEYIISQRADKSQEKHSVDPEAEAEERPEQEAEGDTRLPEAQDVLRLLWGSAIIRIAADKNVGNPLRESRRFFWFVIAEAVFSPRPDDRP